MVDISGDPELESAYREQIPVVFVAGRKAFKYRVEPLELATASGRRVTRRSGLTAACDKRSLQRSPSLH